MNKLFKLLLLLLIPAVVSLLLVSCEEDYTDKLTGTNPTGSTTDVSSRITGFDSQVSGAGATLTATGSNLSGVKRVIIAGAHATNIEATESSVSFTVPTTVPLGEQVVNFVFAGSERGKASIEMVALPVVTYFDLQNGSQGQEITVYGNNFDFVTGASVGGVPATVSDVSSNSLTITVPANAETGVIGLESPAGDVTSPQTFYACDTDTETAYCLPLLNGNGGFENGTIGILGEGGDIGGDSFTAGAPGAQWEIIESPGGIPGLGTKSLKVTINELAANPAPAGGDTWRIQWVNNGPDGGAGGFPVDPSRRFMILGKIWADQSGRVARVVGGRRTPCCGDFAGSIDVTLNSGWNVIEVEQQHSEGDHNAGDNRDEHASIQVNINFEANLGGVIILDDFRMVDIGPYQE